MDEESTNGGNSRKRKRMIRVDAITTSSQITVEVGFGDTELGQYKGETINDWCVSEITRDS